MVICAIVGTATGNMAVWSKPTAARYAVPATTNTAVGITQTMYIKPVCSLDDELLLHLLLLLLLLLLLTAAVTAAAAAAATTITPKLH